MDYFRHLPPHNLGYLGPVSSNLSDAQIPWPGFYPSTFPQLLNFV